MIEDPQNTFEIALLKIVKKLPNHMRVNDYRDYIISFLLLRYLSNNYVISAMGVLGFDYHVEKGTSSTIALQKWYDVNDFDVVKFEGVMYKRLHYVILPQFLWGRIVELARTQDKDLLHTLQKSFNHIEGNSFQGNLKGLFSHINLDSIKLGGFVADRNTALCMFISKISEWFSEFLTTQDMHGDVVEYLIKWFANHGSNSEGDFYTPHSISSILTQIVTLNDQYPSRGKKKYLGSILDFSCGSGSLLLNVRSELGANKIGKIFGQEINSTIYNLARMNMLLHGVKDVDFEIFHGDTLTNEWDIFRKASIELKPNFDVVVANPPSGVQLESKEAPKNDIRFKNYGSLPGYVTDFAFLLHGLHYLKDEGTMAIMLHLGALFREGLEEPIRKKLLDDGNIDTIIGLPHNLLYSTGSFFCILVLKKGNKKDNVLFIDASKGFEEGRIQNSLRDEDVEKIVSSYQYRIEEEGYSRRVSLNEIIEMRNYDLRVSSYINSKEYGKKIDLQVVHQNFQEIENNFERALNKHNRFLKELGLQELPRANHK